MLTFKEKYEALLRKDSTYEGIFYAAVKTTIIFCRPTCRARKPLAENVVFYDSVNEALLNGYRPCKVCKPLEPPGSMPNVIKYILSELVNRPFKKIKDKDLVIAGIEPNFVRRWFKKNLNMTFHAYQRMYKTNNALRNISKGKSVTQTAFDNGYDSLSGFIDNDKSIFGKAPTKVNYKNAINIVRFTTPLGPMFGCATSKGICLVEFCDRDILDVQLRSLEIHFKTPILPGQNKHLDTLQVELGEYFQRKRTFFTVPLHIQGTDFQQEVWSFLKSIPYGKTISYKAQSINMNKPKAIRAVASANGLNKVAIVVPCHRVIGSDGKLKGYGGGIARKKWLIEFEKGNILKGS
ncbi:MAG: methylated-DNA--[protein]-cysteine S-methyltransferase [Calditrichaeota bacterium]|nr:MAG: methylated-DNA--[protein]-cysteine S-methyltransferase [Calditrichota bacterium]MBL1207247.1 methylated-DNA--[protein]-cysteine S-methyltransferase [Calditrichota bacterium]NOG47080.1 methylated-DNA--[protein]-cysteine S-methyltransferase [Calditrichota bacterium]